MTCLSIFVPYMYIVYVPIVRTLYLHVLACTCTCLSTVDIVTFCQSVQKRLFSEVVDGDVEKGISSTDLSFCDRDQRFKYIRTCTMYNVHVVLYMCIYTCTCTHVHTFPLGLAISCFQAFRPPLPTTPSPPSHPRTRDRVCHHQLEQ